MKKMYWRDLGTEGCYGTERLPLAAGVVVDMLTSRQGP